MLVFAGLGNPGRRYAGHRHNIGFMVADEIHRRHHMSAWRARFEGEVSEGMLAGEKALVLKPATFMNESGRSLGQAMRFYKLEPADIVVFYDEIDLPPGKVRMKAGGGKPSHNGLRSITAHIGNDYRRMRIGIGHPGHKSLVHGYVLKDFSRADRQWVDAVVSTIADHVPVLVSGNDSEFMNKVHLSLAETGIFDGEAVKPAKLDKKPGSQPDKPSGKGSQTTSAAKGRKNTSSQPPVTGPQKSGRQGALGEGLRKMFGLENKD